jgi:dihydrofolate reductase
LQLKKQPGKDMVVFGGADLISTFVKLNLIDEFRLIVNPVILGRGTPLI